MKKTTKGLLSGLLFLGGVALSEISVNAISREVIQNEQSMEFKNGGDTYKDGIYWIDGELYAFDSDGNCLKNQWYQQGSNWYYLGSDGKALREQWLDNYYLTSSGYVAHDEVCWVWNGDNEDIYAFDSDGRYLTNQWYQHGGDWYYLGLDGKALREQWLGNYYFDYSGMMAHDEVCSTPSGDIYAFDSDGNYLKNQWYEEKYDYGDGDQGSNWYYLGSDGKALREQWLDNYYLTSSGYVAHDGIYWVLNGDNEDIYAFDSDGNYLKNQWYEEKYDHGDGDQGSNWYYLGLDGKALREQWLGNYYFDYSGMMVHDEMYWIVNADDEDIYVFDSDGNYLKNQWYEEKYVHDDGNQGSNWYYLGSDGKALKTQWFGNYYFDYNGMMAHDEVWQTPNDDVYAFDSDGNYLKNQWYEEKYDHGDGDQGSNWYYLGSDGKAKRNMIWNGYGFNSFGMMQTDGLSYIKYDIYFFDSNGNCLTGWQNENNRWYYLDYRTGKAVRNTWVDGYYLDRDTGAMAVNGIYCINDGTYRAFDEDGYMVKTAGWHKRNPFYNRSAGLISNDYYVKSNGEVMRNEWLGWYWFGNSGYMAIGPTETTNGDTYFFDMDGNVQFGWLGNGYYDPITYKMVRNQWIGDYYVGYDGCLVTDTYVNGYYVDSEGKWDGQALYDGWRKSGDRWWYTFKDGSYAKDSFYNIDGYKYYFDKDGYMLTGWNHIDNGDWYYFGNDGKIKENYWLGNYYIGYDGLMATDTYIYDNENLYLADENGNLITGWKYDNSDEIWEYFDDNSFIRAVGWKQINGIWYYFHEDGHMANNEWIEGYYVDSNGVCA